MKCECGCGAEAKPGRRFIQGHNSKTKGKKFSEEHKQKIGEANSKALSGRSLSEEHKRKIREGVSKAHKGVPLSEEHIQSISGENHHMFGKHHSEETKRKMREAKKRNPSWNTGRTGVYSAEALQAMSDAATGRTHTLETRKKIGESHRGEKSPNWRGGLSLHGYPPEFNQMLRNEIKERDNYQCQQCHQTEEEAGYPLCVHHIDYDKNNNDPANLITLCNVCHSQTNFSREEWTDYFKEMRRAS